MKDLFSQLALLIAVTLLWNVIINDSRMNAQLLCFAQHKSAKDPKCISRHFDSGKSKVECLLFI